MQAARDQQGGAPAWLLRRPPNRPTPPNRPCFAWVGHSAMVRRAEGRRFDPLIAFHLEIHRPDPPGFIGGGYRRAHVVAGFRWGVCGSKAEHSAISVFIYRNTPPLCSGSV
jgi:hypothetical protein